MRLTKLTLPLLASRKIGAIENLYSWHQYVWSLMATPSAAKREFLYRLTEKSGAIDLLILSQNSLHISGARELELQTERFEQRIFRFSIVCNAVKRTRDKYIPLTSQDELVIWAGKHIAKGCDVIVDGYQILPTRKLKKNESSIPIHTVELQGIVRIKSHKEFSTAMQQGYGRQKAFGYGLLTLTKEIS